MGLEAGGRKSSDSEITGTGTGSGSGDDLALRRSTDCIVSKELASSSDSDLLRHVYKMVNFSKEIKIISLNADFCLNNSDPRRLGLQLIDLRNLNSLQKKRENDHREKGNRGTSNTSRIIVGNNEN